MDEHLSGTTQPPAVAIEAVVFSTPDGRSVLDGLSLSVGAHETVSLVGRSGSGKTTLLKLINRLLEASGGTIRIAGVESSEWDPVALRRRIGYVIQEIGLFPHLTVAENVGLVPGLLGWPTTRIANRVTELLEMVDLSPGRYASKRPRELSGGERQRVGVARALAADPPLVLLDEPFGALDPITRHEVRREFRALMRSLGKAALFVTHDLREALEVGDRVGLLSRGRIDVIDRPGTFVDSHDADVRSLMATVDGSSTRHP